MSLLNRKILAVVSLSDGNSHSASYLLNLDTLFHTLRST
jgi:hypothetical protein